MSKLLHRALARQFGLQRIEPISARPRSKKHSAQSKWFDAVAKRNFKASLGVWAGASDKVSFADLASARFGQVRRGELGRSNR